jgi:Sulfotransferase family
MILLKTPDFSNFVCSPLIRNIFLWPWLRNPRRSVRRALWKKRYNKKLIPYRSKGKKIVHILHIRKTGGNAVKEAIKANLLTGKYKIELHKHDFGLRDVPSEDKVVFFVREPISRFISGFYSRKRKGYPKYYIEWSREEKVAFSKFNTPNELAAALSSMDRRTRKAAIKAMKSIRHVNSSYWDWFDSKAYFLSRMQNILFIGFQESLSRDFFLLRNILNLPETVVLPKDDIRAHRNPSHLDTHLTKIATTNLSVWYAKDYQFNKLCKEKAPQIKQMSLVAQGS